MRSGKFDSEWWNSKKRVTKCKDDVYRVLPPATQEEQFANEKERKARTLLLMAVPKDHLRRSKKLLITMDALGAGVSDEDANHTRCSTRDSRRPRVDGKMHVAFDKRKVECFNCHNTGHFARECKFKGSKEGNRQEAGKGQNFKPVQIEKEALMTIDEDSYNLFKLKYDELQSELVLGYEEEISRGIFAFRETDAGNYDIPLYSRFKQVEYKGVPHPLSGDYTPREQEDIDDSLYEYGKYGPQPQSPSPTESDASSTVYSTCQSNDSGGELGAVSDHSVNDDPIHDHIPIPSIEQVTIATQKTQPQVPKLKQTVDPSCAQHVKTPRQPIRTPVTSSPIPSNNRQNWNPRMERELGTGYSFERKPCFVCGSLSHLIKDCDYYEKKMAREAALKSKRVVHADVRQATPAWDNSKVPFYGIQHTRSNNIAVKAKWALLLRPQQDHPLKHMEHKGIFDSGCSGHMTGNRAHLEDYQELSKVGSVTFGGSKGSISGKGTIRLGNLVFDDVAFVKELGHFNLFSISQICDKKLNVLFTEKECFVVSSDFKMPDENQVLLKVPRQHNMYTFDMKNVDSSKGYTCLLAKASSDEAKLWHRRLGHLNFKNLNKLVKGNLVRGLPSKSFKNDLTCVDVRGKANKASCKAKIDRYVTTQYTPCLWTYLVYLCEGINHAKLLLVITVDCSKFCWILRRLRPDGGFLLHSSTEATRKAVVSEKIAKKKTHSPKQPSSTPISKSADDIMTFRKELDALALKHLGPVPATAPTSTNPVNTGSDNLNTGFEEVTPGNIEAISPSANHEEEVFSDADDDEMPEIRIYDKSSEGIFEKASYDDDGIITDFNNLPDEVDVSTNHTLRIHNAHPQSQILGDPNTPVQTRSSLKKITEAHALVSHIQAQQRSNHKDQQHCLFACFLSQSEPRKVSEALEEWEAGLKFAGRTIAVSSFQQKDERGVVVIGKKKGLNYDEVFAPVGRDRSSGWFWAPLCLIYGVHSLSKDVISAFLYGHYDEEGLQVKQNKLPSTPMENHVAFVKDVEAFDVDVTPKTSHLNVVKKIFKYLKGKPNLGLWYPRESPFDLEAFSDSDYGGSNLDRKSTTGVVNFLVKDSILMAMYEKTIVSHFNTEAEYVSCCKFAVDKVLWVQNNCGTMVFNFMNTKKSTMIMKGTICFVKNRLSF
ncbi:ribonuclease H-like domain-containing protein [Tanacetum coccineum]